MGRPRQSTVQHVEAPGYQEHDTCGDVPIQSHQYRCRHVEQRSHYGYLVGGDVEPLKGPGDGLERTAHPDAEEITDVGRLLQN